MVRVKQIYEQDQATAAIRRIKATFDGSPKRVFTKTEILRLVAKHRDEWKVLSKLTPTRVMDHLMTAFPLKQFVLEGPTYQQTFTRYLWREVHPLEVAASIRTPGAYLCHSSALFMHGLIDAMPKELCVNAEQSEKPKSSNELLQASVDRAFRNKQRQSAFVFPYLKHEIVVLNGKHTEGLEVDDMSLPSGATVRVTGLERTLIDIVVRPTYAGGVKNVLEAYRRATKKLSIEKMIDTLQALDHAYPYHQAIGFYLDRAGYPAKHVSRFRSFTMKLDFYLAHNMKDTDYSAEWKLFYPKGL